MKPEIEENLFDRDWRLEVLPGRDNELRSSPTDEYPSGHFVNVAIDGTRIHCDVWGHEASLSDTISIGKAIAAVPSMIREISHLQSRLHMSNIHLFKMLDEMEARYDLRDEEGMQERFDSPAICLDYIAAAMYCEEHFGRKNNRITQAREWYDNQI